MEKIFEERFACRKFSNQTVEEDKINQVVKAGLLAPSGRNTQEGIILVIKDKKIRDEISALNASIMGQTEGFDPFYGAPVILIVLHKKSPLEVYNGSAMIENMLLEATNLKLGSCWIHRAKEEVETPYFKELLAKKGLDSNLYTGIGHVALGYSLAERNEKAIKDGRVFEF